MAPFDYKLLLVRLLPETILILGGLVVLFFDQARASKWSLARRSNIAAGISAVTGALAILAVLAASDAGSFYNGMLVITPFTKIVKIFLLILTIAALLISSPARFTSHIGEYFALILFAAVGLLLLAVTEELLTAFISLELTSLSLYLLTAFNKQSATSAEAALKYFLFGSVAAAFTLFGISLVFGLSGSTSFHAIASALRGQEMSSLLIAGLVLTAIGFGFKMAAAPLHLWAPDAYQGAPIPSAAMIAAGSKLASLVLFMKFFIIAGSGNAGAAGFGQAAPGWLVAVSALAAVSIIVGNLLAIAQSNLRRLIAYSAIAHGGYVLIALLANNERAFVPAVYYMFTYGVSVIGAFGVIGVIEEHHGELSLQDLTGLSRRAPLLAISLAVFILSLAGIPPLAGFFGKFYVFLAALQSGSESSEVPGLLWIVILAIAGSTVSLYYYLKILKECFVSEGDPKTQLIGQFGPRFVIALLAAATIVFGCFPNLLVAPLHQALTFTPVTVSK